MTTSPPLAGVVSSEWLRLRSRPAVMGILLAGLLVVVGLGVGQVLTHEDDYAQAAVQFRQDRADRFDDELAAYRATLESVGREGVPSTARELTREEYAAGWEFYGGQTPIPTKRYVTSVLMVEMTKVTSVILAVTLFLCGVTSGAAEWATRGMRALFLWEPRRVRVLASRMVVVACIGLLATLVGHGLGHALGLIGGSWRGTTEGVTAAWWMDQGSAALRGSILAAAAGAWGVALGMIARNTGFAVGVGFVWVGIVEALVTSVRPQWEPYTIKGAAVTWLEGGRRMTWPMPEPPAAVFDASASSAALLLTGGIAVFIAAAALTLVRRDA